MNKQQEWDLDQEHLGENENENENENDQASSCYDGIDDIDVLNILKMANKKKQSIPNPVLGVKRKRKRGSSNEGISKKAPAYSVSF